MSHQSEEQPEEVNANQSPEEIDNSNIEEGHLDNNDQEQQEEVEADDEEEGVSEDNTQSIKQFSTSKARLNDLESEYQDTEVAEIVPAPRIKSEKNLIGKSSNFEFQEPESYNSKNKSVSSMLLNKEPKSFIEVPKENSRLSLKKSITSLDDSNDNQSLQDLSKNNARTSFHKSVVFNDEETEANTNKNSNQKSKSVIFKDEEPEDNQELGPKITKLYSSKSSNQDVIKKQAVQGQPSFSSTSKSSKLQSTKIDNSKKSETFITRPSKTETEPKTGLFDSSRATASPTTYAVNPDDYKVNVVPVRKTSIKKKVDPPTYVRIKEYIAPHRSTAKIDDIGTGWSRITVDDVRPKFSPSLFTVEHRLDETLGPQMPRELPHAHVYPMPVRPKDIVIKEFIRKPSEKTSAAITVERRHEYAEKLDEESKFKAFQKKLTADIEKKLDEHMKSIKALLNQVSGRDYEHYQEAQNMEAENERISRAVQNAKFANIIAQDSFNSPVIKNAVNAQNGTQSPKYQPVFKTASNGFKSASPKQRSGPVKNPNAQAVPPFQAPYQQYQQPVAYPVMQQGYYPDPTPFPGYYQGYASSGYSSNPFMPPQYGFNQPSYYPPQY